MGLISRVSSRTYRKPKPDHPENMKLISVKSVFALTLLATTFVTVFADEEVDEEAVIESEDEAEIEEEAPVDEAKLMEEASGIVDPSNYPGRIISRKKITSKNPAAGVPLEFEYTIWNVGSTEVVDVELQDKFSEEDWVEAIEVSIKVQKIPAWQAGRDPNAHPQRREESQTLGR